MNKIVNLLPFNVNFSIIVVLITILVVIVFGTIVLKTVINMVRQRKAEVDLKLPSLTEDASQQNHEEVFHKKENVFDKNIYISHGEDVIIDDSTKTIDENKFIEALSVATGKVIIEEPDMPALDIPVIEEIETEEIENDSNEELVTATDENQENDEDNEVEEVTEEVSPTNEPLIKDFNEADYSEEEMEEVISKALIEKNSNDDEIKSSNEVDIKDAVEQELSDDGMDDLMDQLLSHEEESK